MEEQGRNFVTLVVRLTVFIKGLRWQFPLSILCFLPRDNQPSLTNNFDRF